jgi:hypothetical protein
MPVYLGLLLLLVLLVGTYIPASSGAISVDVLEQEAQEQGQGQGRGQVDMAGELGLAASESEFSHSVSMVSLAPVGAH